MHVCRVLSLLKLNTDLIDAIEKIGNPMPTRIVTERSTYGLRSTDRLITGEEYAENHKMIVFHCEYQRQWVKKENV